MKEMTKLYICDRQRCEICSDTCKHTTDIEHAKNNENERRFREEDGILIEIEKDEEDDMKIDLECETRGFEEAIERVDALKDAFSEFPPQVAIRGCRDCNISIYPLQILSYESHKEDEDETD